MGKVIRKKGEGVSSFDTDDLAMAAALLSKGYEMICMHPKEHSRSLNNSFIYHFKITSSIEKTAENLNNNKLQIEGEKFKEEVKKLSYQMILGSSI